MEHGITLTHRPMSSGETTAPTLQPCLARCASVCTTVSRNTLCTLSFTLWRGAAMQVVESRAAAERLCSQLSALLASDEADLRVGAAVEAQMEAHKATVLLGLDGLSKLIGGMSRIPA
eukprot:6185358-Pleurochrysis_carterae.AAC.4